MKPLLVLATRNRHKAEEVQQILDDQFQVITLANFPEAPVTVEDQDTFAGNAAKKALELARWLAQSRPPGWQELAFVMADDSGLEVDALGGAPGVHSARYAFFGTNQVGNAPDADNNEKLLHALERIPAAHRSARFRCAIALIEMKRSSTSGEQTCSAAQLCEGTCEGRIQFDAAGTDGFGYDPLFVPEGFEITFAQLGDEAKNRISHRARALSKLGEWLVGRGS